jgi:hypothetical protein
MRRGVDARHFASDTVTISFWAEMAAMQTVMAFGFSRRLSRLGPNRN